VAFDVASTGGGSEQQFAVLTVDGVDVRSCVLTGLHPNTLYAVVVEPLYTNKANGEPSNMVYLHTSPDVPYAAPSNVRARILENDTILLTWEPPPAPQHNGFLIGYKVYLSSNETKFHREVWINSTMSELCIHHLDRGATYRIQIAALNKVGEGPRSSQILIEPSSDISGEAAKPWFVITIIVCTGSSLWLAICVVIIWLVRYRRRHRKRQANGAAAEKYIVARDAATVANGYDRKSGPYRDDSALRKAFGFVDGIYENISSDNTLQYVVAAGTTSAPSPRHLSSSSPLYSSPAPPTSVALYGTQQQQQQKQQLLHPSVNGYAADISGGSVGGGDVEPFYEAYIIRPPPKATGSLMIGPSSDCAGRVRGHQKERFADSMPHRQHIQQNSFRPIVADFYSTGSRGGGAGDRSSFIQWPPSSSSTDDLSTTNLHLANHHHRYNNARQNHDHVDGVAAVGVVDQNYDAFRDGSATAASNNNSYDDEDMDYREDDGDEGRGWACNEDYLSSDHRYRQSGSQFRPVVPDRNPAPPQWSAAASVELGRQELSQLPVQTSTVPFLRPDNYTLKRRAPPLPLSIVIANDVATASARDCSSDPGKDPSRRITEGSLVRGDDEGALEDRDEEDVGGSSGLKRYPSDSGVVVKDRRTTDNGYCLRGMAPPSPAPVDEPLLVEPSDG
jgi:hypothetical protein